MDAMTSGVIQAFVSTVRDRHDDMRSLVGGFPAGGLTWSPGGDAPAIAGLVLHVLDVERYLTAIATGHDIGWTGTRGTRIDEEASESELLAAIDDIDRTLHAGLLAITEGDLASPAPGGALTVGQALVEDLDHVATHLGQMQLTRHLFEVSHPAAPRMYEHWR